MNVDDVQDDIVIVESSPDIGVIFKSDRIPMLVLYLS